MHNRSLPETINQVNTLIFSVMFILTATVSIFLFTAGWVLTNPDRYKEAFWESGLYPRIPAIAAEQTASFFNNEACRIDPQTCTDYFIFFPGEELPGFLMDLSEEVWLEIFSELLTSNWAQEQAELALDQYFAYLSREISGLSIQISLEYPKERLRGGQGERVFQHIVNAQSPCSADILLQMVQAALQGTSLERMPICRIPEEYTGYFSLQVNQMMERIASSLPDQVNLAENLNNEGNSMNPQPGPESETRSAFEDFRTLSFLSPLAPLVLALLVIVFGVRTLKGMLLWLGIPLIFTGVLVIVISFPLVSPISSLIATQFFRLQEVHYPNLLTAGFEASSYLAGTITSYSRTVGIVLAVAGFLLMAFSLVVPSREHEVNQP